MPVQFNVEDYLLDMTRVTEDVFRTMFGIEVTMPQENPPPRNTVTAAVQFAGDWKGAVILTCSLEDSFQVCARMMSGLHPVHFDEDVRDSLGELANMLGGNLKSVLPPGVVLSIPIVTEGKDFGLHLCGGNDARTMAFAGEMGEFEVTLVYVED